MDGSNMTDAVYAVSQAELRGFIERIEASRARQADEKAGEKDIFAELAGRGYMKGPIRKIVKLRAESPEKRAEEEAVLDLYKSALGML